MVRLFPPELAARLLRQLVGFIIQVLQEDARAKALDERVDLVLVFLDSQQRRFGLGGNEVADAGLARHGKELLIAARFAAAGRGDEELVLVRQEQKKAVLVDRSRLGALEHDLLKVQLHASANEHLRVGVGAQHQGVDLAVIEAVFKGKVRRLAERFDQLFVARDVAEKVGHAALDVSLGLRIVFQPFSGKVVIQVPQQQYFVGAGPFHLLAGDDLLELVDVLGQVLLVGGEYLDFVDGALFAAGPLHLPEQLDAGRDVFFRSVGPVSVVGPEGVARHFGHGHDAAGRFRGGRVLGNEVVGEAVVDGMHANVAQARGFGGGDGVAGVIHAVARFPVVRIGDPHQPAAFIFPPAQPANGQSQHVELKLSEPVIDVFPAEGAAIVEDEGRERFAVPVGQAQHLIVGEIVSQNGFRPFSLGQHQVALLHAGATHAADQEVLLGVDVLEFEDVVIVIGTDDDKIVKDISPMLLHHIDECLVKISFDVQHESAPFGIGHGGVVIAVEGSEGIKYRIDDGSRFA